MDDLELAPWPELLINISPSFAARLLAPSQPCAKGLACLRQTFDDIRFCFDVPRSFLPSSQTHAPPIPHQHTLHCTLAVSTQLLLSLLLHSFATLQDLVILASEHPGHWKQVVVLGRCWASLSTRPWNFLCTAADSEPSY